MDGLLFRLRHAENSWGAELSLAAFYCQCVVHRQSIARWAGYGQQTDRQSRDSATGDAVGGGREPRCEKTGLLNFEFGERMSDSGMPRRLASQVEMESMAVTAARAWRDWLSGPSQTMMDDALR